MQRSPFLLILFSALACSTPEKSNTPVETVIPAEEPAETTDGTHCFLLALNKDSTFVNLTLKGDSITGTMRWRPWEKDGATGTLAGLRAASGELDLLYDYMIEGQRQTETKVMKVENGTLWIKTGELVDPANDGNLRYADVSKATYSQQLPAAACP